MWRTRVSYGSQWILILAGLLYLLTITNSMSIEAQQPATLRIARLLEKKGGTNLGLRMMCLYHPRNCPARYRKRFIQEDDNMSQETPYDDTDLLSSSEEMKRSNSVWDVLKSEVEKRRQKSMTWRGDVIL